MGTKLTGIALAVVLLAAQGMACGKTDRDGAYKVCNDSELGISFEYPASWEFWKSDGKIGLFAKGNETMIVFTAFRNIPENEPVERVFENAIVVPYREKFAIGENRLAPERRGLPAAELGRIGAESGYKGQFAGMNGGKKAVFSIALFIKGTAGYQVFAAIDEEKFRAASAVMIRVMNSFRIR